MSVEAALIAAIAAAPDDDEPRLVYADHLMQRGDPRGELIALQCQLARADAADEPFDDEMIARERQLLAEHAAVWTLPYRAIAEAGYQFRRGFVEHVTAWSERDFTYQINQPGATLEQIELAAIDRTDRLAQLMEQAPLLRSLMIRSEVTMHPLPPSYAQLHALHLIGSYSIPESIVGALHHLRALRRLHLSLASLADLQAIAFLDLAQPLEHLGIHLGWHISARPGADVVTERIAMNSRLHALRSLHLAGFEVAGVHRLECLPKLERLAIDRCRVEPANLIALVSKLPALEMLEYQYFEPSSPTGDDPKPQLDLEALLAVAPKLRRLAVSGCTLIGDEALASSSLRRLILDRGELGDARARALVISGVAPIELQITGDELTFQTDDDLKHRALRYRIAPASYPPTITQLMRANKIMAVKAYRELTGCGLADAKMAVELIDEDVSGRTAYQAIRAQSRWCRP